MASDRADESGFPRELTKAPSQKEVAIQVVRKAARISRGAHGDLVIAPAADDDTPLVTITDGAEIVSLLTEIRDGINKTNELLMERLR